MNRKLSALWQGITVMTLGLCALTLRLGLYTWAVDAKGLLRTNHICAYLLWPVTLAAVAFALLPAADRRPAPNALRALSSLLAAAGVASLLLGARPVDALPASKLGGMLTYLWLGTLPLAVAALLWEGVCHLRGKGVSVLAHAFVCLFLMVHLLTRYRVWSGEPQLLNYVYSLFACLSMLASTYCRGREDIGQKSRRIRRVVGLIGVFCAIAALPHADAPWLYAGFGVWLLMGLEAGA